MKRICIVSFFTLFSFSMEHDPFKQQDVEDITYEDLGILDPLEKTSAQPSQKESDTVQYQCMLCTYSTVYKDNMVTHAREHSPLTDVHCLVFSCHLCNYRTRNINNLKVHYCWHINADFMEHKLKLLQAIRRLHNADKLKSFQDQLQKEYQQRLQSSNPNKPNHEALVDLLQALRETSEGNNVSDEQADIYQEQAQLPVNNNTHHKTRLELLQALKQLHNVTDSSD